MRLYLTVWIVSILLISVKCFSQVGITASPPKLFYRIPQGGVGSQKVTISNPLSKDLEVGVSLGDWAYDSTGNNSLHDPGTLKNSCTDWIKVLPGAYFTLLPQERKELEIELSVPKNADSSISVHTAMVYFTQLNPNESKSTSGAAIKVTVRMGIKIYHSFSQIDERNIEVTDFHDKPDENNKSAPGFLEILLENTGKLWIDGKVKWEMLNTQTGEKIKLEDLNFLCLPGDHRILLERLPADLKKGRYSVTAIVNYGNKDELKVAELEFEY